MFALLKEFIDKKNLILNKHVIFNLKTFFLKIHGVALPTNLSWYHDSFDTKIILFSEMLKPQINTNQKFQRTKFY
jgi:hypothetical protein